MFSKTRLPALDALRGLNIAAMIVYHYNLLYFPLPVDAATTVIHTLGSYVAPLFLYLAGAGTWFFLLNHPPDKLLKRGIFLFLLATLIGVFPKGHLYVEWTLIQDIGCAFVLTALLARFTSPRLVAALLIYGLCFVLFLLFHFQIMGVFPIFPSALYFLIGYGFAGYCPTRRGGMLIDRPGLLALAMPAATIALAWIAGQSTIDTRLAWYLDALNKSGTFMLLYFVFLYVLGHWQFEGIPGEFLLMMGRVPLTSYYVQQTLLRFLQAIGFQIVVVNPFVSYLIVLTSVLLLIYALLAFWRRWNFTWSLEWIMRRL